MVASHASHAPKLSSALKQLVTLPSASTTPTAAPAKAKADAVWRALSSDARAHSLPRSAWLTLSASHSPRRTASVVTLNSPEALCRLYDFATSQASGSKEEAVRVAALLRDTSLKCISFNGIPRTINSLTALDSHLPPPIRSLLSTSPLRLPCTASSTCLPTSALLTHGRALWDDIYGPFSQKLIDKLGLAHPDMPGYILTAHYGALLNSPLSPRGTPLQDNVGRRMTSLIAVACLRAQGGVGAQLTSHVYGLRSADEEWDKVDRGERKVEGGEEWLSTNEGVEWVLRQVDQLVEVFGKEGHTFGRVKAKL